MLGSNKQALKVLCTKLDDDSNRMHKMSALHLQMILEYYDDVLMQAKASFLCAVVLAIMGFGVLVYTIMNQRGDMGVISGALIEFTSATVFWVYKRTTEQFSTFHICLERTNRYLMAFNICETIKGDNSSKDQVLRDLACIIANASMIGQKERVPTANIVVGPRSQPPTDTQESSVHTQPVGSKPDQLGISDQGG
jgi:hypothetical protein